MAKPHPWTNLILKTVTPVKKILSNFSVRVRTDQLRVFTDIIHPKPRDQVLDVGVTSEEIFPDSNFFVKNFPYPRQLTLATIEDHRKLQQIYPSSQIVKIFPRRKLPFTKNEFDIVTSWATLEHVGNYSDQKQFLQELLRVGKKVFLTTPYRGCIYEPHTGFFFLHWLPLFWFRWICQKTNNSFWTTPAHLNPLWIRDIRRLVPNLQVKLYKIFGVIPSHLLIYK